MKVLASEGASEARLDAIKHALVALVAMNALALYVLSSRVASMEVTRE